MALAKNTKIEKWNRKKTSVENLKIIKNCRNWVEVGANEIWIGQIDAEFDFTSIPHVKNSQILWSFFKDFDFFEKNMKIVYFKGP